MVYDGPIRILGALFVAYLADRQADFLQFLFGLVEGQAPQVRYEDFFALIALADGQVDSPVGLDDSPSGRSLGNDFAYWHFVAFHFLDGDVELLILEDLLGNFYLLTRHIRYGNIFSTPKIPEGKEGPDKGDEEDAEHTDDDGFLRMIADRIHEPRKRVLLLFRRFIFGQVLFLDRLQFLRTEVIRALADDRPGAVGVDETLGQAQFRHHLADGLETVVRVLGHGLEDDLFDEPRDAAVVLGRQGDVVLDVLQGDADGCIALEGNDTGHHFIHDDTQGVDIRPFVDMAAAGLFR